MNRAYKMNALRFTVAMSISFACVILQSRSQSSNPPASESRASDCTTKEDRFRARKTISLAPRTIFKRGAEELKLGFNTTIESDSAPRDVELLLDSTTERLRYGNSAEINFIIEGKRVGGGTAYKIGGSAMRQVNEKLKLTIIADNFLAIATAREVEMQIGETEVTLRREDLQRMRDFAACINLSIKIQ